MNVQIALPKTRYEFANESLPSIVSALNPMPGDVINAVLGSGDQALALARYGANVVAFDNEPSQLTYVRQRFDLLGHGDYTHIDNREISVFEGLDNVDSWRDFYKSKDWITDAISRVTVQEGCIFGDSRFESNKYYLSNALTHSSESHDDGIHLFANFAQKVPAGSLIYLADGFSPLAPFYYPNSRGMEENYVDIFNVSDEDLSRLHQLELCVGKTNLANKFETRWVPTVLRKKEKKLRTN